MVHCVLLYLIRVLIGVGGEADCDMRAEALAVLSEQGVAKSLSLSSLDLYGKPGVCVCACMQRAAV